MFDELIYIKVSLGTEIKELNIFSNWKDFRLRGLASKPPNQSGIQACIYVQCVSLWGPFSLIYSQRCCDANNKQT